MRIDNSFIILEPHHFSLPLFLLLHTHFKLILKSFFTVHAHLWLLILLLLLTSLQRTLVRIMTLLLTVKANNTHVLHLTDRIHHLNLLHFSLSNLFLLAIRRLVPVHATTMTNESLFIPERIRSTMHRLRYVNLAINPILVSWEVSQS